MKTIRIPGGLVELIDDCVDLNDDLHLVFTTDGDVEWGPGADDFTPPLVQGPVKANQEGHFQAPATPLVVHGTFTASATGKPTPITIRVKDDHKCRDK